MWGREAGCYGSSCINTSGFTETHAWAIGVPRIGTGMDDINDCALAEHEPFQGGYCPIYSVV